MTHKPSNAPSPDDLLLTAREALKTVLREPDSDHAYTILMAMNAMGIAARAIQTEAATPVHPDMSDKAFVRWIRRADEDAIVDPQLMHNLRRHVQNKLAVSNPRFSPEPDKSNP